MKTKSVSREKWNAAVEYMTGKGTGRALTGSERNKLSEIFRGPFYHGHPEHLAVRILTNMGWHIEERDA